MHVARDVKLDSGLEEDRMSRSLGSATLACLLTTWMIVPGLSARNLLYTFYGELSSQHVGNIASLTSGA